jgi:hypothetical protein
MEGAARGNRDHVDESGRRSEGTPLPADERPRSASIGEGTPPPRRRRSRSAAAGEPATMIPSRGRRRWGVERVVMRVVATGGVVGIGVVLGAPCWSPRMWRAGSSVWSLRSPALHWLLCCGPPGSSDHDQRRKPRPTLRLLTAPGNRARRRYRPAPLRRVSEPRGRPRPARRDRARQRDPHGAPRDRRAARVRAVARPITTHRAQTDRRRPGDHRNAHAASRRARAHTVRRSARSTRLIATGAAAMREGASSRSPGADRR